MGLTADTTVPYATSPSADRPGRGVIVRDPSNGGAAGPPDWRDADALGGNTLLGLEHAALAPAATVELEATLSERLVYVVQGSGRTDFLPGPAGRVPAVEWRTGDVFALTPTVPAVHFADADGPVELLTFSNAPMVARLFGEAAAPAEPFTFVDRFDPELGWQRSRTAGDGSIEANVLRAAPSMPLRDDAELGHGTASVRAHLGGHQTLSLAVVELGHRSHVRRHRHVVEEAIVVLAGRGRTVLTGPVGEERTFRWRAGDVFVPPLGVWHQHVSEAKPWDLTRLLVVRNTALEHAFGVRRGQLETRLPDRLPTMVEPDYGQDHAAAGSEDVRASLDARA